MSTTLARAAVANTGRRRFLQQSAVLGGGLVLGFHLPASAHAATAAGAAAEVNAWIVIAPDDSVTIRVARSEMGQGSFTGLPMLVAEELECDWSKVRAEYAPTAEHLKRNRVFVTMATGGSRAIRDSQEYLRRAGATARAMLVGAAADAWQVPAGECVAANSWITHSPSGRRVSFGQVAAAAARQPVPSDIKLKDPKGWKLLGRAVPRLDLPDKVTGKPVFGIDAQVPGMVYAAIAQSPVFGGKPRQVDEKSIAGRRGVIGVVTLDDAVAVLADNWWRADQALRALKIDWDSGDGARVGSAEITALLRAGLAAPDLPLARNDGDCAQALASATKTIEAEYAVPFLNHATMEPQTCTAWVRDGRVDIWVPTQNSEAALAAAANAAGVPQANVEVHKMHLGGGFGRRGAFQDFVHQAVGIAVRAQRPVQLIWSREEDIQHDFYRPASLARMQAGLDDKGLPVAWQTTIACPSILSKVRPDNVKNGIDPTSVVCFNDLPYAIPNQRVAYALRNTHVPVGFWRAVGHTQNPFFRECFLDEIAVAGGQDPYALRRQLLANSPKDLGVLDAAAKGAGWGKPLPRGHGRGIACQDAYGSYAAAVIEVSVDQGELKIHRIVLAVDPGYVVNSDSARAQAEGCVAYALSAALWGEITIQDGRVAQSNFNDYRLMRLREYPPVEVLLVPSGGFWGGMGEPPMAPLAPALCNAIFAATGKRLRSLPIKQHDLRST